MAGDPIIKVSKLGKRYVLNRAGGNGRFAYRRFSDVLLNAIKAPLRAVTPRPAGNPAASGPGSSGPPSPGRYL